MAIKMGSNRSSSRHADEAAMFEDLTKIQFALAEHCFEHLQVWQRIFARWMLTLAARTVGTKPYSPSCGSGVWVSASAPASAKEAARAEPSAIMAMIQKSYDRDIASQKARVSLRLIVPEADDRYFEDGDGEGGSEFLPALVRFRERAEFKLRRV